MCNNNVDKNIGRKSFKNSVNRNESCSENGGKKENPIKAKCRFQSNVTAAGGVTSASMEHDACKNRNIPQLLSLTDY